MASSCFGSASAASVLFVSVCYLARGLLASELYLASGLCVSVCYLASGLWEGLSPLSTSGLGQIDWIELALSNKVAYGNLPLKC